MPISLFFTILYTSCGVNIGIYTADIVPITAIQFFTILYTSCGRKELLLPIQMFTEADIKVVAVSALVGILADTSE